MTLEQDIISVRTLLEKSANPLFFFDDDVDGTSSFLLLRRYLKVGRGIAVKKSPNVTNLLLKKVEEIDPDLVIILDKPDVEEEFFNSISCPSIIIDHHVMESPFPKKVFHFNPRKFNPEDGRPTTYWAYVITGGPIWIATLGIISDWYIPEFIDEFKKNYKDLLPKNYKTPGDIFFKSRLGDLIKIIAFSLKGPTTEVKKTINTLLKIESPYEILDQTTPNGKYIYKRSEKTNKEYNELLKGAKKQNSKEKLFLFEYSSTKTSVTSIFSNEIVYNYPDKFVIIARESGGEYKMSLRSEKYLVLDILKKALIGIEGRGGGHEHACGAVINKKDFNRFLDNIKEQL